MFGPELIIHDFRLKILKIWMHILCNPLVPKGSEPWSMWLILYDGDKEGSGPP